MDALLTPNKYGECAAADVQDLVFLFQEYVERRGANLAVEPQRLVTHILKYISLRQKYSRFDISAPLTKPVVPVGWTSEDETIWTDWLWHTCDVDSWENEVLEPIFGTDIRLWEATCEGWRLELMTCFPWWIQRSFDIIDKFNPTQPEIQDEDDTTNGVDSYIMDHGSAKQKKAAMRAGV
jgi:hypothetical protein